MGSEKIKPEAVTPINLKNLYKAIESGKTNAISGIISERQLCTLDEFGREIMVMMFIALSDSNSCLEVSEGQITVAYAPGVKENCKKNTAPNALFWDLGNNPLVIYGSNKDMVKLTAEYIHTITDYQEAYSTTGNTTISFGRIASTMSWMETDYKAYAIIRIDINHIEAITKKVRNCTNNLSKDLNAVNKTTGRTGFDTIFYDAVLPGMREANALTAGEFRNLYHN